MHTHNHISLFELSLCCDRADTHDGDGASHYRETRTGVLHKLSDQLGKVPDNGKLQQDIIAGRRNPEDCRKGIITCENGD